MITAHGTLKLTSKERDIKRVCGNAFVKEINKRVTGRLPAQMAKLKQLIYDVVMGCDEVQELQSNDDIRGQMGLNDVNDRFHSIAWAIANSTTIQVRPFRTHNGQRFSGGIIIQCAPANNTYLYALAESYVGGETNQMFEWLRTLLEAGTSVFIPGFHYMSKLKPDTIAKYSRTRIGIMTKDKGRGWSVPSSISGTADNNFITRLFSDPHISSFINNLPANLFK